VVYNPATCFTAGNRHVFFSFGLQAPPNLSPPLKLAEPDFHTGNSYFITGWDSDIGPVQRTIFVSFAGRSLLASLL